MALPILRGADLPTRRAENYRETGLNAFNPWRELEEMNRWFEELTGRSLVGGAPFLRGGVGGMAGGGAAPEVDLYESPDELRLFVYAPGASPDGFDISVAGNALAIRGVRRPLLEGENWTGHGSGVARMQGTFQTSYTLPVDVDPDGVSASYQGGILELRLPKVQKARVRSVRVNVENRNQIEAGAGASGGDAASAARSNGEAESGKAAAGGKSGGKS